MNAIERLANAIAGAVKQARSTVGVAEKGIISGSTVVTSRGVYAYDAACPINLYNGRQVWVQVTENGTAVVIG